MNERVFIRMVETGFRFFLSLRAGFYLYGIMDEIVCVCKYISNFIDDDGLRVLFGVSSWSVTW